MDLGNKVAARIRELRKSRKMTQEKLAEVAGIDASFLGRIERGQSSNLQINTIEKIIDAFEIDYATFFSFQDMPDRKYSIIGKLSLSENEDELLDIIEKIIELDAK